MRCRGCIQKIVAGEGKIQDKALVTLAKASCSKFVNAWAMWEKERSEEKTKRSVDERSFLLRRSFNGPKVLLGAPPGPIDA